MDADPVTLLQDLYGVTKVFQCELLDERYTFLLYGGQANSATAEDGRLTISHLCVNAAQPEANVHSDSFLLKDCRA